MLLLTNLGEQNGKLDKMGIRTEVNKSEQIAAKLNYYEQNDGSKRFDSSKDGSRRVDEDKIQELNTKNHGPAVDIIDLINNVGKR